MWMASVGICPSSILKSLSRPLPIVVIFLSRGMVRVVPSGLTRVRWAMDGFQLLERERHPCADTPRSGDEPRLGTLLSRRRRGRLDRRFNDPAGNDLVLVMHQRVHDADRIGEPKSSSGAVLCDSPRIGMPPSRNGNALFGERIASGVSDEAIERGGPIGNLGGVSEVGDDAGDREHALGRSENDAELCATLLKLTRPKRQEVHHIAASLDPLHRDAIGQLLDPPALLLDLTPGLFADRFQLSAVIGPQFLEVPDRRWRN